MSDFPTLKEEVNRKAFETLQKIHDDFTLGKINKAQYKYGVDIAWSLVSGFIAEDIFRMFELMGKETEKISYSEKRYFRHIKTGSNAIIIDSKVGLVAFKIMYIGQEDFVKSYDYRQEPNPYKSGAERVNQIANLFLSEGFIEI